MNQLQTHPAAPAGVHRTADVVRVVAVAVLALAALLVSLRMVDGPSFVPRVTFVNHTSLDVDVDTSASQRDGWTPAGVADGDGTTSFQEVIDHGDTWWFRFSEGGRSVVFPVSRSRLAADGWRVEIPSSFGTRLATRGQAAG